MLHLAQSFSRFPSSPSLFASGLLNAIDGTPWALFFFLLSRKPLTVLWLHLHTHTHMGDTHRRAAPFLPGYTHTHTHVQHVHGAMERPAFGIWVVKFSQSNRKKKTAFARVSHSFFFFSILLIPSAIAAAAGGGGVELLLFFSQPAKDRSFASVRSFIHFIFLLFPSFQFSCVFFFDVH